MGTWSTGPFGNDFAVDWSEHLDKYDDLSFIDNALNRVLDCGNRFLDAVDAEEAIAAADTISRLKGKFTVRDRHTEHVDAWVAAHPLTPPSELVTKAVQALDRVMTEPSEAYQDWQESKDFDEWRGEIDSLKARIQ